MTAPTESLDLLAALTDSTGTWGSLATADQWADAESLLSLDGGPRRHVIGRSKGYSKTRDVAALSLVALLTQFPPSAQGFAAAADADQAGFLRQAMAGFVEGTPELKDRIRIDARKVSTERGAEIHILAADSAGAHGILPYWLVCDELCNWPDDKRHRDFFDNLWAGLVKVRDSRGIIISTAGTPEHFSKRIFDTAECEPGWRTSILHGPPPWIDPAEIAAEQRRMFPSAFARLWLNEWAAAEDSVADPDDVDAACVLVGPLAPDESHNYVCTLDLAQKRDNAVAVIAHAEHGEHGTRVVVDRMQVWEPRRFHNVPLDDVRLWLTEFCRSYRAKLIYDPDQAYLMVEQLRKTGIRTEEFVFSSTSVSRLAMALTQALRGRTVLLPDDDELRKELLAVRLREISPHVMKIETVGNGHDDRAIAVALAIHELTSHSVGPDRPGWVDDFEREFSEMKAQPWSLSSPMPRVQPDQRTVATLDFLQQVQKAPGWNTWTQHRS